MAQDCRGRWRLRVLLRREQPPHRRRCTEHRQQVRGDPDCADALGRTVARQVEVRANRERDLFEAVVSVPDVEVLRGREPVLGDAETGRPVPQDGETIRVLKGKRPEEESARDAEDRGVRADAQGQRQHRRDRKGGRGGEGAPRATCYVLTRVVLMCTVLTCFRGSRALRADMLSTVRRARLRATCHVLTCGAGT